MKNVLLLAAALLLTVSAAALAEPAAAPPLDVPLEQVLDLSIVGPSCQAMDQGSEPDWSDPAAMDSLQPSTGWIGSCSMSCYTCYNGNASGCPYYPQEKCLSQCP